MTLYILRHKSGSWYKGISPTGRVLFTSDIAEAQLFTDQKEVVSDPYDSWGFDCYSMEVSDPVLIHESTAPIGRYPTPATLDLKKLSGS